MNTLSIEPRTTGSNTGETIDVLEIPGVASILILIGGYENVCAPSPVEVNLIYFLLT